MTTTTYTDRMTATIRSVERVKQHALDLAGYRGLSWVAGSTFDHLYAQVRAQLVAVGYELVARRDGEHMLLHGTQRSLGNSLTVRMLTVTELFQPGYTSRALASLGLYAPVWAL